MVPFVITITILFPLVIVDSKCLKSLNINQNHLLLRSTNFLKHRPINIITKLLVTVVEVIVFTIEDYLENLNTNPVLSHAQILVQSIIIITPFTTFVHTMIVNNLAITNIIKKLLQDYIVLFAQIIVQHLPLEAHINPTLVLTNAFLVKQFLF